MQAAKAEKLCRSGGLGLIGTERGGGFVAFGGLAGVGESAVKPVAGRAGSVEDGTDDGTVSTKNA